jgi:hypothetical protein
MSTSELLWYAAIAGTGGLYWLYSQRDALSVYLFRHKPEPPPPADPWRDWVQTLMTLQRDLEDGGAEECVPLVRELIWRMLGGEPNDVLSRAGQK